jgi:hypothetical protein
VGGTGGQAGEHRGIMAKLMDVQAAQDSRRSKLFAWRPSTAAQGETTSVVLHSGRWHQRMGWGGRRSTWGSRGGAGEGLEEANTGGVLTGLGVVTVGPWRRCWFWTRRQGLDLGCEGDGMCGAVARHSGAAVTTSQRWAGAER